MAITRDGLLRLLPAALGGEDHAVRGDTARVGGPGRGVAITIRERPPRRIAGLAVERSEVTLDFTGYDEAARERWLERFDRAFRRGGG